MTDNGQSSSTKENLQTMQDEFVEPKIGVVVALVIVIMVMTKFELFTGAGFITGFLVAVTYILVRAKKGEGSTKLALQIVAGVILAMVIVLMLWGLLSGASLLVVGLSILSVLLTSLIVLFGGYLARGTRMTTKDIYNRVSEGKKPFKSASKAAFWYWLYHLPSWINDFPEDRAYFDDCVRSLSPAGTSSASRPVQPASTTTNGFRPASATSRSTAGPTSATPAPSRQFVSGPRRTSAPLPDPSDSWKRVFGRRS